MKTVQNRRRFQCAFGLCMTRGKGALPTASMLQIKIHVDAALDVEDALDDDDELGDDE